MIHRTYSRHHQHTAALVGGLGGGGGKYTMSVQLTGALSVSTTSVAVTLWARLRLLRSTSPMVRVRVCCCGEDGEAPPPPPPAAVILSLRTRLRGGA